MDRLGNSVSILPEANFGTEAAPSQSGAQGWLRKKTISIGIILMVSDADNKALRLWIFRSLIIVSLGFRCFEPSRTTKLCYGCSS